MKNTKTTDQPKITYQTITAIYFKNNFVNFGQGTRYVYQKQVGKVQLDITPYQHAGNKTHDKQQP